MLYTVVPLERVYHNFRENDQLKFQSDGRNQQLADQPEYREIMLKHGRVVTRRDGDNYIIEKINSTDMGDYLNAEYAPGQYVNHRGENNKPN